jgi:hypothetical protein
LVHNLRTVFDEELNVDVSCSLRAVGLQEGDHVPYPTLKAYLQSLLQLRHHPGHLLLRNLLACKFRGGLIPLRSLSDYFILFLINTNIFFKLRHPSKLMEISVLVYVVTKIS